MRQKFVYHVHRIEEGNRQEYPFDTLTKALKFIANGEKRKRFVGSYELYRIEKNESWAFSKEKES